MKLVKKIREEERIAEIGDAIRGLYFKIGIPIYALFEIDDLVNHRMTSNSISLVRLLIIPAAFLSVYLFKRAKNRIQFQLIPLMGIVLVALESDIETYFQAEPYLGHYAGLLLITMATSVYIPFTFLFWMMSVVLTYLPFYFGYFFLNKYGLKNDDLMIDTYYIVATILICYFFRKFSEGLREKELGSRIALQNEVRLRDKIISAKTEEAIGLELAVQRNALLTSVAMQVSHDIRSPLSALNLVIRSLKGIDSKPQMLLVKATEQVNNIANELLNKAKGQGVIATLESLSGDQLRELIEDVIAEKKIQGTEVSIQMELSNLGANFLVTAVPYKLKRILSNLVNNSVEAGATKISMTLIHQDRDICINIVDNGRGIPAEILPKLMSEGFTHDKQSGNGLGLFMARQDVERWGGTLHLSSDIGKETTVSIRIPYMAEQQ